MTMVLWALWGMLGCGGVRSAQQEIVMHPENDAAWVAMGDAYRRALKPRRAQEAYGQALVLNPENSEASTALAEMSGRNPRVARRALRNPSDDELWGDAGDYYLSVGRREEALSAYLHAMRLDPGDTEWLQKALSLGALDDILGIFQQNSGQFSDESLGDVGDALSSSGHREQACEMYRRAATLDPTDDEWTQRVAECEGRVPRNTLPTPEMDALSAPPPLTAPTEILQQQVFNNEALLRELGLAHAQAGDLSQAQKYLHSALLLKPNDEATLEMYTAVTGRSRLDVLEQLIEEVPNNDEVLGEMGDQLLSEGRRREALVYYRRALEIDPNDPEWTKKKRVLQAAQP